MPTSEVPQCPDTLKRGRLALARIWSAVLCHAAEGVRLTVPPPCSLWLRREAPDTPSSASTLAKAERNSATGSAPPEWERHATYPSGRINTQPESVIPNNDVHSSPPAAGRNCVRSGTREDVATWATARFQLLRRPAKTVNADVMQSTVERDEAPSRSHRWGRRCPGEAEGM